MLKPVRTVAPSTTPVTLAELKTHCRADDFLDDDAVLQIYLDAAVAHLDGYTGILGRAMVTQTWKQEFCAFDSKLRLPVGDLISVTSVKYYDADNSQQTLATSVYTALTDDRGPYVTLKPDQSWPDVYDREDAVEVIWTAGFGAASSVPAALKAAIMLLAGNWYENRESVVVGMSVAELPMAVAALIAPYRQRTI